MSRKRCSSKYKFKSPYIRNRIAVVNPPKRFGVVFGVITVTGGGTAPAVELELLAVNGTVVVSGMRRWQVRCMRMMVRMADESGGSGRGRSMPGAWRWRRRRYRCRRRAVDGRMGRRRGQVRDHSSKVSVVTAGTTTTVEVVGAAAAVVVTIVGTIGTAAVCTSGWVDAW